MLKKCSLVFVLFALTIAFGCAQVPANKADTSADIAKLEADALSWFDHYAKADADGMANLYADDALLMPPGAPAVRGKEAIKAFLGQDAAKTKSAGLVLRNGSVTGSGVDGDIGWISGNYSVLDSSGMIVDSGSYLSVHRRVNDSWPYIRDIWNSDRPPTPAPAASGSK